MSGVGYLRGSPMRRLVLALSRAPAPVLAPVLLLEVELSRPISDLPIRDEGIRFGSARVLVKLHDQPLGVMQLTLNDLRSVQTLGAEIEAAFGGEIDQHLDSDGLDRSAVPLRGGAAIADSDPLPCQPVVGRDMFVSVVIPTVGRESLTQTVESVLRSTHRDLEVVVVDNTAWNPIARDIVGRVQVSDSRVRYAVEPRPGASSARNHGLRAAKGAIVAFTDDDAVVDERWLTATLRGFQRADRVVAVTGLTVPQKLDTPAEVAFELYGGFGKGFQQRLYDLDVHRGPGLLYPYTVGFGAGNNMAVVKEAVLALGGFDDALGPGTPTYADEDLDLLLRIVLAGHQVSYEPSAIVRHAHRSDWDGLKWQVFTYSAAMTAMLTKAATSDRRTASFFARQIPKVLPKALVRGRRMAPTERAAPSHTSHQRETSLLLLERLGFVYGPIGYARSAAPALLRHWIARRRPVPSEERERRSHRR